MSDILKYYQDYYTKAKENGYRMERWKDVSRVAFLKQYITQFTPKGGNILDIGCGDMYLSTQLTDYNWTGLDASNEYSQGKALVHDIMVLPYPVESSSQDTVMCSEVLEHVWEPQKIHHEAFRTLKPGGTYIISTPNFNNLSWVLNNHKEVLFEGNMSHHYEHIRWYTYEIHKQFLENAGFQVVDYTGADAHGVDFFQEPRAVLYYFFKDVMKTPLNESQVDQLLGQMFRKHCATIMLIAKKPQ
jgi:2-polyprenyl-3-methyl-5-hydroxy-6-metoxy-1,4-benzoquinol methylase